MPRLRRFNIAFALLILGLFGWWAISHPIDQPKMEKALEQKHGDAPSPTDLQRAQLIPYYSDKELEAEIIEALKSTPATSSQQGSPLSYGNWGYSKLGSVSKHDDTISACGKRKLDSNNKAWYVAGGAWNNETRKWHVAVDSNPGDGICVPNKTKANNELHRTCIRRAPHGSATRCGKKRSFHRG